MPRSTRGETARPTSPGGSERVLRADAKLNQDRVLEAAAAAFARPGAETSMKAIARDAGVGIATLYRRFPAREDLIEAVYRNETARLGRSAATLLRKHPPPQALRTWLSKFLDYLLTKEGMAEALPAILAARDGLRMHSRGVLRAAIDEILRAGIADGSLRADVSADDVMMAAGGIGLIAAHEQQRALAARLADLLMDSLTR